MNTIKIKQGKPDPDYNTIFTFSAALLTKYMHMRQYFDAELKAGIESFDGKEHTWKMNLSQSKIELVITILKKTFQEMETAHGFTEEIIPGQPKR